MTILRMRVGTRGCCALEGRSMPAWVMSEISTESDSHGCFDPCLRAHAFIPQRCAPWRGIPGVDIHPIHDAPIPHLDSCFHQQAEISGRRQDEHAELSLFTLGDALADKRRRSAKRGVFAVERWVHVVALPRGSIRLLSDAPYNPSFRAGIPGADIVWSFLLDILANAAHGRTAHDATQ
mgnify:CR=1 FL=1